jgi:hypothetical protein
VKYRKLLIDVSAGLRTGEVQKVVDRCLCRAEDWGDEEETKYRDWVREQTARRGDQADFSGNATNTLKGLSHRKRSFLKITKMYGYGSKMGTWIMYFKDVPLINYRHCHFLRISLT